MAFPNQRKLTSRQTRNSGKALLELLRPQWGAKTSSRLPCLLLELQGGGVWGSWFLIRGEVGVCPGIGLEGWLMCLAHPFGGAVCKGHI